MVRLILDWTLNPTLEAVLDEEAKNESAGSRFGGQVYFWSSALNRLACVGNSFICVCKLYSAQISLFD
ncbi:MAG: hypothetical protein QW767_02480 [Thermoprotei archaeon]